MSPISPVLQGSLSEEETTLDRDPLLFQNAIQSKEGKLDSYRFTIGMTTLLTLGISGIFFSLFKYNEG